jgi:hypothetical protein
MLQGSEQSAEAVLHEQWRGQIQMNGIFYRTAIAPEALPTFVLPHEATMGDLRTRVALVTNVPADNQLVVGATCILPDEDDFPLLNAVTPSGQPPRFKVTIANESRLVRWAKFDNIFANLAALAAVAALEYWGETLDVLQYYIKRTFSAALEQSLLTTVVVPADTEGSQRIAFFNTGLATAQSEQLFGVFRSQQDPADLRKWHFHCWMKEADAAKLHQPLPAPATFTRGLEDVVWQNKLRLHVDIDGLLTGAENRRRLEDAMRQVGATE